MKSWTRGWLAISVPLALSASVAWAQAPAPKAPTPTDKPAAAAPADKPGVVVADVLVVSAPVEAVDKAKRTVTIKGQGGRSVTLMMGPEVKNFDQIKVGDTVQAKYVDAIALFVRKSGEPPDAAEMQAVSVAPKGKKPMAMALDTVEVTAKVEKIDHKNRLITLKGPEGKSTTIKVDPRVKKLGEVKVGDEIVLRRTEAVAIEVVKPKS
jgi:hypothetical protein